MVEESRVGLPSPCSTLHAVVPADQFSTTEVHPTLWGLSPVGLHDLSWSLRGVRVVRAGDRGRLLSRPELFLLTGPDSLVTFRLRPLLDPFAWIKYDLLTVRLKSARSEEYSERLITSSEGAAVSDYVHLTRSYYRNAERLTRVALTRDPELADLWRRATDVWSGWRELRAATRHRRRGIAASLGSFYAANILNDQANLVDELVKNWSELGEALPEIHAVAPGVWAHETARIDSGARFLGKAWIGAGRCLSSDDYVVGPAVLWDIPEARPAAPQLSLDELDPTAFVRMASPRGGVGAQPQSVFASARAGAKRTFDVIVAAIALLVTIPIYPLIMAAIWLEDGRPFLFGHLRESKGGREFRCWKFRSMRKDAERIKITLATENAADGPQFFIEDDPRTTRVGKFLRKSNLDELPQFWSVLKGDMSIVGPRPSPYKENQFAPAWRDARLSVRPGITGLWQVMRTRQSGRDFQEWIRYDLIYVHRGDWKMDLLVLWLTFRMVLGIKR